MNDLIIVCFLLATSIFLMVGISFVSKGRRFALRDRLEKADAVVVFAGTRGNLQFLNEKILTAARLYKEQWAPKIFVTGRFSAKVGNAKQLIPQTELVQAVYAGRIQEKDLAQAVSSWDEGLGATYMAEELVRLGVPKENIFVEDGSLHTKESIEYTLRLIKENGAKSVILVTSPFHQLRTFLTFRKAAGNSIRVKNYYASGGEWHPLFWFFSRKNRELVASEKERIIAYAKKGDL